jgi:hypothetical protein
MPSCLPARPGVAESSGSRPLGRSSRRRRPSPLRSAATSAHSSCSNEPVAAPACSPLTGRALPDANNDELGRFERGEPDEDRRPAGVNVGLVIVEQSHLTTYAWSAVRPANAPRRNRSCRNAPTLSLSWAHSGSSFGSKTTHPRPRSRGSSRCRASRRTGRHWVALVHPATPPESQLRHLAWLDGGGLSL